MSRLGRSFPNNALLRPPVIIPVSWDATGVGAVSATSPVSFTDTIPSAANCTLIWAAYATTAASPTIALTVGGTAATLVQTITWGTANPFYYLSCFQLMHPPAGSQSISFSCTSLSACALDTIHYSGVAALGTPTSLTNQTGQPSISVSSLGPNVIYSQAFVYRAAAAGNTYTGYSQTQRELVAAVLGTNPPLLIGDAPGNGGTLTFSATRTSTTNPWGGIIVPLLPV